MRFSLFKNVRRCFMSLFLLLGVLMFSVVMLVLASGGQAVRAAQGGSITEFAIPTLFSSPDDIALGSDNAFWFTEFDGNKIGRISTSGKFTEFAVPTANSQPVGIVQGPGDTLWFTEQSGGISGVSPSVIPTTVLTMGPTTVPTMFSSDDLSVGKPLSLTLLERHIQRPSKHHHRQG